MANVAKKYASVKMVPAVILSVVTVTVRLDGEEGNATDVYFYRASSLMFSLSLWYLRLPNIVLAPLQQQIVTADDTVRRVNRVIVKLCEVT